MAVIMLTGSGESMQRSWSVRQRVIASVFVVVGLFISLANKVDAGNLTACTATNLCYCINDTNLSAINENIEFIRQKITDQRAAGKAIGYISIPLSTVGGSYLGVNSDVAKQIKEDLEKRFSDSSAWVLNPAAEKSLPATATGADYMYQWTKVLEGRSGLGEDFDFIYFVGPLDFARFFALTGEGDMQRIDAYFDKRLDADTDLKKAVAAGAVKKSEFRNYYALRASVSFSLGSHDEWNIARLINERRRGAADFGIARQWSIMFDGRAIAPGTYEQLIVSGDAGRCVN
jgi:hypothetical protein